MEQWNQFIDYVNISTDWEENKNCTTSNALLYFNLSNGCVDYGHVQLMAGQNLSHQVTLVTKSLPTCMLFCWSLTIHAEVVMPEALEFSQLIQSSMNSPN